MTDSILLSIKKMLGVEPDYDYFDNEIIAYINSAFFHLKQIGVSEKTFNITGDTETWSNYLTNIDDLALVKDFIYLRVRKTFDPPTSGILMTALNEQLKEAEWRLYSETDFGKETT